jgi:hypothetical protein
MSNEQYSPQASPEPAPKQTPLTCATAAPLMVFYACDEVSDAEKTQLDAHLAACAECSAQLRQERQLLDALSAAVQPADLLDGAGVLLAQCRSELSEKLDEIAAPAPKERWQPFGWARRWMALRPAWSAAVLVVFGVTLGTQLIPWLETANDVAGPAVNVLAAPKISDEQLSRLGVSGIRFSPSTDAASANIQLHLNAQQPIVLTGNVDDPDVRKVMTFMLESGERFNVDTRLDCLDGLKPRSADAQVRKTLLDAAHKDQSAAVRMKALESLRDAAQQEDVRDAVLDIVAHDPSSGVRIGAVNLLVRSVEQDARPQVAAGENGTLPAEQRADAQSDAETRPSGALLPANIDMDALSVSTMRVIRALEECQQKDPSRDMRSRCAAALRQIGVRPQP